ncbi:uncharacterized protein [Centruroides vittatus]|uniref:uncharacterized protein n=1 Tax=Centruroides vittatus TaxID=120091 RepID=UPI00350FB133
MHNKTHRDEDYLPYTNSYHQKAPYLVWEDRYTPHRKRKKKRCQMKIIKCCRSTSAIVTIVSVVILAIFAIISLSAYLGVITNFYPSSSIFILYGKLLINTETQFPSTFLNISSEKIHPEIAKYQYLLQSIYSRSILQHSIKSVRVHTFGNHSDSIYFHIYLDQNKLHNITIGDSPKIARRILSQGLTNLHLENYIQFNISLLEDLDTPDFLISNISESIENYLFTSIRNGEVITEDYREWKNNDTTKDTEDINIYTETTTRTSEVIEAKEEAESVESHQNVKKSLVVNYGSWLPYIPTNNPLPTDRIITIPFSTSRSQIVSHNIDIEDEDEDLLEERRLRPSVEVNNSQILHKFLSVKASNPTSSLSIFQSLTNETKKVLNVSSNSELFPLERTDTSDKQDWVPIFITKQSKRFNSTSINRSTFENLQNSNDGLNSQTKFALKENETVQETKSYSSEYTNFHPSIDNSSWQGYYALRRRSDSEQSQATPKRTGLGEAHVYALESDRQTGDSGFIPVTPVSTTELTVGVSLHINLKNRYPNPSSFGNLKRIYPLSTTRKTSLQNEDPSYNSRPQSSFLANSHRNSGSSEHRYGSEYGSLNVERTLSLKRSNRSVHSKQTNDNLKESMSTSRISKNFSGIAKVISSDMSVNMMLSSTMKPFPVEVKSESQNEDAEISEISQEIKSDEDLTPLKIFSSKNKDSQMNKNENLTLSQDCSQGFRCGNDGKCLSWTMRCNRRFECGDLSDEMNCSCIEYFWAQRLHSKICDGIIDCWDQTDELQCPWCSRDQFICPNSKKCIEKFRICDGIQDCPFGSDESHCMKLTETPGDYDHHHYSSEGFVAVRKNGVWGMMCSENLKSSDIEQVGQSVCNTLTYRNFNSSVKSSGSVTTPNFYKFDHLNIVSKSSADVQQIICRKKEMIHVSCNSLECGIRPIPSVNRSRIIGGQSSQSGSWPWQVALYREGEFQCGAVLINDRWLMTAAHCFFHSKTSYWTARLGLLRRGNEYPSPYEEIRVISNILIYPGYKETGFINDIALLGMKNPVQFSDYIRPVCLPGLHEDIKQWNNRLCTVVGWGKLFEVGHLFPDTLQEVWLPVVDTEECRKRTVFLPLYKITEQMFCAGYERGGRDACLGDSGGPLLCQRSDGRWTVVGITSNGDGCGRPGRPGVYTKVTSFLSWVHSILEKDSASASTISSCNGHRCQLGKCVAKQDLCNGVMDCWDGSDEECSIKR